MPNRLNNRPNLGINKLAQNISRVNQGPNNVAGIRNINIPNNNNNSSSKFKSVVKVGQLSKPIMNSNGENLIRNQFINKGGFNNGN